MALPVTTQFKYWTIASVVFVVTLWFLGDILLPFVLGAAVAYLFDPLADRLERSGLSRVLSVSVISLVAIFLVIVIFLALIPTLINQAILLFEVVPEYFAAFRDFLFTQFPDLLNGDSTLRQSLTSLGETLSARGGDLVNGLVSSVASIVNIVVLIVVVPVVAFYLLLDWDNMMARIDSLLPRDHARTIRALARDMNKTMAAFIRGQGTVCLILGTYYGLALMFAGLQFGIVVGFIAGLISFIPYIGALVGGVLAIGLALFQFWGGVQIVDGVSTEVATNWFSIGLVGAIFVIGQPLEGNVITPKLVGNSIGLHPVWLIFALSVFGTLFGFVGMLLAVPIAAMVGVIARFLIQQYLGSKLYQGYDYNKSDE